MMKRFPKWSPAVLGLALVVAWTAASVAQQPEPYDRDELRRSDNNTVTVKKPKGEEKTYPYDSNLVVVIDKREYGPEGLKLLAKKGEITYVKTTIKDGKCVRLEKVRGSRRGPG
jgi:hypothetical protein